MPVEAELKRRAPDNSLVAWNLNADGTDPVADAALRASVGATADAEASTGNGSVIALLKRVRSLLNDLVTTLGGIFTRQADGSQKTQVTNLPGDYPLPAAQVTDLKTVTISNPTANPETGLAKENTLASILAQLDDVTADTVLSVLKALNGKDFATQATLAALNGKDFATQATLAALNGKDFATQATLAALNGKDFATQATLAALNGKDFATQATLAAILTALTKPRNSKQATAIVASGAFTTVVSHTPTVAISTAGASGDFSALTSITYRLQMVVGGVVKHEETLDQNSNSWTPIEIDVPAAAAVEVKLRHGEVSDQTGTATIAWREA